MDLNDMVLVSVDDHIIEPPDIFTYFAPARYADRMPRLTADDNGVEQWRWEGDSVGNLGLNAVVTWPKAEWGLDPATLSEMRPGCYDVKERVRDMDVNGVAASLCFPTMARFSGAFFNGVEDRDLALAAVQAYNDWHIDVWCAAAPERFIPLAIPVAWDAELSAQEVRRVAKKGCRAVCYTENPVDLGLPSIHSGWWDPFFAACAEEGTVVCIHVGSSGKLPITAPDAPIDIPVTLATMQTERPLLDFIFSDVLHKFPTLKVALSEGGAGWIPYCLDRLDRHVQNQLWTGHRFSKNLLPTDLFRRHFLSCVVSDKSGLIMAHRVGIENVAIETDYPHSDAQWPNAPEVFYEDLADARLIGEDFDLVTHGNALRFFDFDLFSRLPRSEATVGALRARARDVDTATTTKEQYRERYLAAAR